MTSTLNTQPNDSNPLSRAWLFALAVFVSIPALLFSDFMPGWAPPVVLVGLAVIFFLRGLATGRLLGHTPLDGPVLVLFPAALAALWFSANRQVSLPLTYAFMANLAIFGAVAALRTTPRLHWSGWVLLLAGLVLGFALLIGTNFTATKLPFINKEIYTLLPGGWRPFWNPAGFNSNLNGGLVALFVLPAVVLAWQGNNWQQRDAAKVVAVILTILLFLAQSRGALLGVLVALVMISLLNSRRRLWVWLVVLGGTAIIAYQTGPATFLDMFLRDSDLFGERSLRARQELWERAIYLIRDYPLTGVGLGMVEPTIHHYYPTAAISPGSNFKHAHNIYLQAGAELGVIAMLALLAFYGLLFYLLLRRALNLNAGYYRVLALGLLGSLIVFLTHGFFEVITFAPRAAVIVWGLFGLMAAVSTRTINLGRAP